MRYLILICISLGISGCGGYETNYQASIDKQGGLHEEDCNLRDWVIECYRDAYSDDEMRDCADVFGKRQEDIAFRYNTYMIYPRVTPRHASNQQLSIVDKEDRCLENSQSFYDVKRCYIRGQEDKQKLIGC